MIKISISGQNYDLPTSWKDINYSKFCEIISFEGEQMNFISIISGIPCTTLENIDVESMILVTNLFTFVQDFTFLEEFNFIGDDLKGFNIGSQSWYKLEKSKQEIAKHKKFICSASSIVKIYLDEDISSKPIHEVWGKINFFIDQINKFFEKYKRLSEHEEDEDEFMAGVKRFEQFGFMAQVIELSRKMGCSYDDVLALSAQKIYQTFLYDFEKADYEKVLYKIKSNKK